MKLFKSKKDAISLSRRDFLVGSASSGLLMAFAPTLVSANISATESLSSKRFSPTIWFEINEHGNVTINVAKVEMGQHIGSALARIVAEELECDWSKVSINYVNTDPKWGYMVTGGSWSVFHSFKPLSQAGAAGRIAMIDAGAKLLGVPSQNCRAENGFVIAGAKRIDYGDIVANSALDRTFTAEEISNMPIKPSGKRHLLGKSYKALDIPPKTNGTAVYGIDVEVEGMVYARPVLPPTRYHSRVKKVDDSACKSIPGYAGYHVLTDPSGTCEGWITVVANDYYSAVKAADKLKVDYEPGPSISVSEQDILNEGERLCRDSKEGHLFVDDGNIDAVANDAAHVLESTFTTATVNHFQLEPLNAVVEFKDTKWHVHTGNQWQSLTLPMLAKAVGVSEENVVIHHHYLGGGFGRRLYGDWIVPALLTSKIINKPVKLIFTRPDDTAFDQSRSPSTAVLKAFFDKNNQFTGLEHSFSAGWPTAAMAPGFMSETIEGQGKVDMFSASGADHWYTMEHHRARAIQNGIAQDTFTPGWLRSVGQGWIAWGLESFIDEIAHQTNHDPLQFRLSLLDGKGKQAGKAPESVGGATRLRNVLSLLAEKVKDIELANDEGIGFSVTAGQERTMPAWIATAAHVHVNRKTGKITLKRLSATVDGGLIVHPDGALAQLEGSLLWGASIALHESNSYEKGKPKALNLHTYHPLRMNDLPELDIEFVDSDEFPVGLGEPGVIGVAPAVANAVYHAAGIRLRSLPMTSKDVKAALA